MDFSICILTLNARDYLKGCLESIRQFPPHLNYEILIADNASTDGTLEMLEREYPEIKVTKMNRNVGFTKPNNLLLAQAQGDYLLVLNPDTLLVEDTFTPQVQYLREHPEVGISIPKVLNADGSFQAQSRRGDATPAAVFGYFLGLGKLFPKSKRLNQYLMSWLPEDEINEVDAVSGSCMFITRACYEKTGGFDEELFAYQEDSDLCIRARQDGFKVCYVPITRIIHYGGEGGSKTQKVNTIVQWHRSYAYYYHKHFAKRYFFLFNWFYYGVMLVRLALALLLNLFKSNS